MSLQMMKEKPKRKQKSARPFLSKSFAFVSPLPLEECVQRLEAKAEQKTSHLLSDGRLFILVNPIDENTYVFHVHREKHRLGVEAIGHLKRLDEQYTSVAGYVQIAKVNIIALIIATFAFISIFFLIQIYSLALISTLLMLAIWISTFNERSKLGSLVSVFLGENT